MKTLLVILISSIFIWPNIIETKNNGHYGSVATCYGRTPCSACSNCSGCKYCNSGGSCGACQRPKKVILGFKSSVQKYNETNARSEVYAGNCKALTKKGARCKRSASVNGYCWQHGK